MKGGVWCCGLDACGRRHCLYDLSVLELSLLFGHTRVCSVGQVDEALALVRSLLSVRPDADPAAPPPQLRSSELRTAFAAVVSLRKYGRFYSDHVAYGKFCQHMRLLQVTLLAKSLVWGRRVGAGGSGRLHDADDNASPFDGAFKLLAMLTMYVRAAGVAADDSRRQQPRRKQSWRGLGSFWKAAKAFGRSIIPRFSTRVSDHCGFGAERFTRVLSVL